MRHSAQIGDDGLAGDILAERERERTRRIVVGGRCENFDQLDDLPFLIRQLERHARLAGNRLDDANRYDRERTRQILDQVDDLRPFDPDGGLDLEACDDGTRISREHFHGDTEVGQLSLDQPRREFQYLGIHRFGQRWSILQQ